MHQGLMLNIDPKFLSLPQSYTSDGIIKVRWLVSSVLMIRRMAELKCSLGQVSAERNYLIGFLSDFI
jgi:hypothetical protein